MSTNILKAIAVTAELTQTELSASALRVMASDLAVYPEAAVMEALTRCRKELTGRLTPGAIIDRINDGRPGPEEAWAIAMASSDESETVVWTEEIAQAYAVASPVLEARDKVGARMAFREAYERIVRDAKSSDVPCVWTVSLGSDAQRRAVAIAAAVDSGRLTMERARNFLPAPEATGVVAALLSNDRKAMLTYAADPVTRRGIEGVRKELLRLDLEAAEKEVQMNSERAAQDAAFNERKARAAAEVERLMAERGESHGG